jgi:NitT/TauT family transport system ATP-binding protein
MRVAINPAMPDTKARALSRARRSQRDLKSIIPGSCPAACSSASPIARALAYEPEVLLMDEPFGSLDALTRLELEDTLLRLWVELKTTILFITHDIEEAIYLSDRIWVLGRRPSRIIQEVKTDFFSPTPSSDDARRSALHGAA